MLGHPLGQAAAGEVGHDEHDLVALVDDVDEADDVGVVEPAQDVGLPQQALAGAGDLGGRPLQRQALERHLAAVGVAGQVDGAHAAPPEAGHQFVAVEARVDPFGVVVAAGPRAPPLAPESGAGRARRRLVAVGHRIRGYDGWDPSPGRGPPRRGVVV